MNIMLVVLVVLGMVVLFVLGLLAVMSAVMLADMLEVVIIRSGCFRVFDAHMMLRAIVVVVSALLCLVMPSGRSGEIVTLSGDFAQLGRNLQATLT